ncbi:hypothetical protein [Ornithinibacillus sp. 179-J 7C1 HS]|uniref:hypothetical protein n=1 Tax=Ornithinibacillus sp. 179-J 7C1 HS TaxID=3142384 RepID=UPI0039A2D137
MYQGVNSVPVQQYDERIFGRPRPFGRPFYYGRPFGFGRPFGYGFGAPFVGGVLGGLLGSALYAPYGYGYGYPFYGYGPFFPYY